MTLVDCPDRETLTKLLLGDLPRPDFNSLCEHVMHCDKCVTAAETINASDQVTEAVRLRRTFTGEDKVPDEVIARAKQLFNQAETHTVDETVDSHGSPLAPKVVDAASGASNRVNAEVDFLADPEQPDEIGRLGGYRVLEVMGAGGMGVVFKAEDPNLQRLVALKAMKPTVAASRTAKERFLREARATAAIDHHNIVQIYQVGEDRNVPFIAMQYLRGESLQTRLTRDGKLAQRDVLRIGREVAAGLQAAHEHGLIHRDIKPDNIWLDETTSWAKILDFGLVRGTSDDAGLTHSGTVLGTPRYMAPEQAMGGELDHRSDLFSLGSVMYHLATGKAAFGGSNLTATLIAVAQADPKAVTDIAPDLSPPLARLIMRLLAKEPVDRPQSAAEVVSEIEGIEQQLQVDEAVAEVAASAPSASDLSINTEPRTSAKRSRHRKKQNPANATPKSKQATSQGGGLFFNRKLLIAGGGGVAALLLLAAALVINLKTSAGTIVLEIDDPTAIGSVVTIDGDLKITIKTSDNPIPIEVTADEKTHTLKVSKGGFETFTKQFRIQSGKQETIRVRLEAITNAEAVPTQQVANTDVLPKDIELVPEPVEHNPNAPLSAIALVRNPTPLNGALSWTIQTRHHRMPVYQTQFSPNGKILATAGGLDRTIRLWDYPSRELRQIISTSYGIGSLAFSPGGHYLASRDYDDNNAEIHEVTTGRLVKRIPGGRHIHGWGHSKSEKTIAWHPQGTRFANADDREIQIWNLTNSIKAKTLKGHQGRVVSVCWSPDGRWIATASQNEAILWDTSSWTEKTRLDVTSYACHLAFSPDSKLLATSGLGSDSLDLWKLPEGELALPSMQSGSTTAMVFSKDGTKIFSADTHGIITRWNVSNGEATAKFPATTRFTNLTVTPDGNGLISAGNEVQFLDLQTGESSLIFPRCDNGVDKALWFPNEPELGLFLRGEQFWKLKLSSNPSIERPLQQPLSDGELSPDGRHFALREADNIVRIYNWETETNVAGKVRGSVHAWSPDSKIVAVGARESDTIHLLDVATGEIIRKVDVKSPDAESPEAIANIYRLGFSPDGIYLAIVKHSGLSRLEIWNVETGALVQAIKAPDSAFGSMSEFDWSSDSQIIGVRQFWLSSLYDVKTGKRLCSLEYGIGGEAGAAGHIHLHEDGKTVTAEAGHRSCVYDLTRVKHEKKTCLPIHTRSLNNTGWHVSWSPNDAIFAGTVEEHATFYDPINDRELGTLVPVTNGQEPAAIFVDASGHYRVVGKLEEDIVYSVLRNDGTRQTLTPSEFETQYGWKNDPTKVQLIDQILDTWRDVKPSTEFDLTIDSPKQQEP